MLKNALICPECQAEIEKFYVRKIVDASDMFKNLISNRMKNNKLDNFIIDEWNNLPKNTLVKQKEVKQLPAMGNASKVNIKTIYNRVTQKIIGQEDAIKTILATIVRNSISNSIYTKSNIFLIGGTGCGKSETVKQIAKELDLPFVLEDASKYTQEGYVGESVINALNKLISVAGGDIRRAERGIIIFDEIDKKTSNGEQSGVSTTSVQDSLLKMLEGATFQTNAGMINTEMITFVLIGACEETYKKREKRIHGKGKIGFGVNQKDEKSELNNKKFIPEDLIESGFKSELVGRIGVIQEFKPMDIEMAKNIINKSEISIFNLYLEELRKLGVVIRMDRKQVVESIAKRAVELKTGARAIGQIVMEMFDNIYSEILFGDKSIEDIQYYQISEDTVYDNKSFKVFEKTEKY